MMTSLIRLKLLHMLGVDELVRKAFYEGWELRGRQNDLTVRNQYLGRFIAIGDYNTIGEMHDKTRFYRHVDEAWFNSDAEESI